ncbi:MAG: fasciclin, partial [Prevotella sp.]|nr:fasciclin [Prevotella sp.]
PQGIPLDMTKFLNSDLYIGDRFVIDETCADYDKMTEEEKAEEQKLLKNLGAYRAPRSLFHFSTSSKNYFVGNERTYRRILCQTYMDATKDHYIRFRVASDGKQGNNNEFMLDYLELVPKSVYGVDGDGEMENDL